jgi:hypothetical protein
MKHESLTPSHSKPRDISRSELYNMMVDALRAENRDELYITGYIRAQIKCGWLRKNCPAWIRNSAAVHFAFHKNMGESKS